MIDQARAPASQFAESALDEAAPALWNPNAAANWSLLFSPAFGAYLHMKNWEALGDRQQATVSKIWFLATCAFIACAMLSVFIFPGSKSSESAFRSAGLGMLIGWYVTSARGQAKYVKERFGKEYPRKGWLAPLGVVLMTGVGLIMTVVVISVIVAVMTRT